MNEEINPLANPDIARYFLKGIDIYRQIKPLQEEFANAVESQEYKKANEASQELIRLMTEFHLVFYYRPSVATKRGVMEWRSTSVLINAVKRLYIRISDIEKAAINADLKKFIILVDKGYKQMFNILEIAKEYAEEGLPIPSHHKKRERQRGSAYRPISEITTTQYALPEVKEQIRIRNKVMKQVYSQRARLENWKEFTKHHRRSDIEEEEQILETKGDTDQLGELIKDFEEEI